MKDGSGCLAGSIGIYEDAVFSSTKSPSSVRGRMEMDDGEILKQRCRHDAGGFFSCRGSNKAVAEYVNNRKNRSSSSGDMTQILVSLLSLRHSM